MPLGIENYTPMGILESQKKQARFVWIVSGLVVAAWVFLILLAPIAESSGWAAVSGPIYTFFSYLCHQQPERSIDIAGHQFAVCSRCFGVYFGLLAGFIIYPLIRPVEEIEPMARIWLFASLIPIGIDWSLGMSGLWENTHFSRFATGMILGAMCAIFIIPAIVELGRLLSNRGIKKGLPN